MTVRLEWLGIVYELRPDLLYHNPSDPGQERDLALERPDVVRRLEDGLRAHVSALEVPDGHYVRLRL